MWAKILGAMAALVVLAIAGLGFVTWQATRGEDPAALEARYALPADRFVEIAGARVRLRDEGPKGAPTIVLLHGFSHSLESFDAWAQALSPTYRVVRYDLLGHGLTGPDPQQRYAPEERAAFLGEVLDALAIEKAVVAGNSLGGLVVWRFAARNPERVAGLILISPGAYPINGVGDAPAPLPTAMKAYLLTAPPAGVAFAAQAVYADPAAIDAAKLTRLRDMMRRRGNGAAMVQSVEEFTLPDPAPELAKITAPTLILWGEADRLIPVAHGAQLQEAIAGAQLKRLAGIGHAAQEEAPTESLRFVEPFLAQIFAAPAIATPIE